MKHTQVKYGVDCLWSLLTQEGHIQSLIRKQWEKLKIEGKHKLLAGHNHLLRNNLWKTQVYLEVRIMRSSILCLATMYETSGLSASVQNTRYSLSGGLWWQK